MADRCVATLNHSRVAIEYRLRRVFTPQLLVWDSMRRYLTSAVVEKKYLDTSYSGDALNSVTNRLQVSV